MISRCSVGLVLYCVLPVWGWLLSYDVLLEDDVAQRRSYLLKVNLLS
jgi:hypothetical protein